jgi:hypothetical protein
MEGGFGGGQPYGLAAALAQGRRPPKAGGGPTKYHRLAFRNSLHQANPFPPSKAASPSEGGFALFFDLPLAASPCKFAACSGYA